jgi:hypothetical protein
MSATTSLLTKMKWNPKDISLTSHSRVLLEGLRIARILCSSRVHHFPQEVTTWNQSISWYVIILGFIVSSRFQIKYIYIYIYLYIYIYIYYCSFHTAHMSHTPSAICHWTDVPEPPLEQRCVYCMFQDVRADPQILRDIDSCPTEKFALND